MNNTFSLNRFGKLLAMDGKKYLRNFGITLAILCSINIGNWLISMVFNATIFTFWRWFTIYVAVFLSIILVPAKAFRDINLPREGVYYAILPVSNLEKYLSYVLYCVMTPVFVIFFSWGLDSLLTLIPIGGFENYIENLSITDAMMDLFNDEGVVDSSALAGTGYFEMMKKIGSMELWNYLVGFLFTLGLFMLGNLLFKTHKTGKTLGITIGISYVISTALQTVMILFHYNDFLAANSSSAPFNALSSLTTGTMTASILVNALLTIGIYVGLFFKLKTQKY
ncbi:MAG: hypothetical protein II887_02330 [Bacteroidales bacterium]|nr:hypothetical protein [Bacteroidales bacterium]